MNQIKRNLTWLLISQSATFSVTVAALLIIPRLVGVETFGQLSFAIVFVSFIDLLVNMGSGTFLIKAIAREPAAAGRYVLNAIVLKQVSAAFLVTAGIGLAWALGFPQTTILLIATACVGLLINTVGFTIGAGLTALQQLASVARWNMLQGVVGGLSSLVILSTNGSIILATLALNLSFLIPIPANLRKLWPYIKADHRVTYRLAIDIYKGGIPYFILSALLVVYGTIDIPILQAMTSSDEVGWYTLAYRWVGVPALFAVTVSTAFFPALSAEGRRLGPAFTQLANGALRLVVFVATPAAVGLALIAQPFIDLLYHGQFTEAVPLLRILALHIPIVGLDVILGTTVMAADRQRMWVRVSVAASMFNPLLNVFAIPWSQRLFGNGAIGAAIVTVLTELILMVGAIALRPAGVLDQPTLRALLRMLLASLTMVPIVLALGSAPLAVLVAAGATIYGLASFALRTISYSDLHRWSGRTRRSTAVPVPIAETPLEDVPVLATSMLGPAIEPLALEAANTARRPPST